MTNVEFSVPPSVYMPAEDSYLFAAYLEHLPLRGKRVLDIGCGCGILSITAARHGAHVTAVDINPHAVRATEENARRHNVLLTVFLSDLFGSVKGTFDYILFNAPYLRGTPRSLTERAWAGGKSGREVIDRFLSSFRLFLAPGGSAYLLHSSHSNLKKTIRWCKTHQIACDIVAHRSFFFEKIVLFRLTPASYTAHTQREEKNVTPLLPQ